VGLVVVEGSPQQKKKCIPSLSRFCLVAVCEGYRPLANLISMHVLHDTPGTTPWSGASRTAPLRA
jgi:hypothetical protein